MKKNKKISIWILILLIGVSLTFAYFTGRNIAKGEGALTKGTAATQIKNSTVTSEGNIEIENANDMLPGHKIVSYIKVTATGDNELIPFNIYWEGTNNLFTSLNLKIYKSDKPNTELNISANCNKKQKTVSKGIMVYEECDINNLDKLNILVGEATIDNSSTISKVQIAKAQFINSLPESKTEYYYIILEYPNKDEAQNSDRGQSFNGEIKIEASEANTDITIMAAYIENDEGVYEETTDIPQTDDYSLDKEKSMCSNSAIPIWDKYIQKFSINNLTKSGTSCILYFEKSEESLSENTLTDLGIKYTKNDFCPKVDETTGNALITTVEPTNNLLCEGEDDYGKTYYFRGTGDNNWVKMGSTYWRIIRINGNGTIRLIYSGNSEPAKTGSGTMILGGTEKKYNSTDYYNTYVGFMYGTASSESTYEQSHTNTTKSNILTVLDSWYVNGIPEQYKKYLDGETGFCNDRTPYKLGNNSPNDKPDRLQYGMGTVATTYGPYVRAYQTHQPTFKCPQKENDLFTTIDSENGNKKLTNPIGLITIDEVIYAGAYWYVNNTTYYLYTSFDYWTMSPYYFNSSACIFIVKGKEIDAAVVSYSRGVRPVINLKADTKFTTDGEGTSGEKGTSTNPFVVQLN